MTNRERVRRVLNFETVDRLPAIEWATWWNLTIDRWRQEGMPANVNKFEYFGLDDIRQYWLRVPAEDCPRPKSHGAGVLGSAQRYEQMRPLLFNKDAVKRNIGELKAIKPLHDRGDFPVWITLEGFFWYPRWILGIENHLYSFYDEPELYHRICSDLVEWQLRMIDEFCSVLTPDFMTFAEDMSYNHGPMLSKKLFDEFNMPYYKKVVPELKARGIKVLVDSDGYVPELVGWLREAGVEGILPLERQAGTDIAQLRKDYPDFLMIGGYDKMIMKDGEAAMRQEFERVLPVMKSGGYIPSVDHQTPPQVSLENYKIYVKLLKEYGGIV